MGPSERQIDNFIKIFRFEDDFSKPGRNVSSVKIGGVYITRVIVEPGVTTGNLYHKDTRQAFYVGEGEVHASFEHVRTKERKDFLVKKETQVVHIPEYVAIATKNIGHSRAVLVFFSNKPLRSEDTFDYKLI